MDETQKRKLSAREFIQKNKKIGFIILVTFLSLFIIYISFFIFYSSQNIEETTLENNQISTSIEQFVDQLFPVFKEENRELLDEFGLPRTGTSTETGTRLLADGTEDNSKLVQVEAEPILSFIVFEKPTSIKKYIQKKPKICDKKLNVVLGKDEENESVSDFQNMLKSMEGYENIPVTGKLDEDTRGVIFAFQTRYGPILYKNKKNQTPTRVIDKETVHFLNLLCNFDTENKDDYINIPTVRYVKKENLQIVDYNIGMREKQNYESKTATGTDVGSISPDGNFLIIQKDKLTHVETSVINTKNRTQTTLEKNVVSPSWNNLGTLAYGIQVGGTLQIKVYDPSRNLVKKIATIPLEEWAIFWQTDTQIGLYNKPTSSLDGIFLILNTTTGTIKQVSPHERGLSVRSTNNPDFSILSVTPSGTPQTLLMNNKTKNVGNLGLNTFAEKCAKNIVFDGVFCAVPKQLPNIYTYPDDWYKGKVTTSDDLVYKTISGTSSKIISSLEDKSISVIDLTVEKTGIFFLDENTRSLYTIDTTER